MNIEQLNKIPIILASSSPRRQAFFKELGLNYRVVTKSVDETYPKYLKREKITNFIALKKTRAFNKLKSGEVLVTADTIVWFKHTALEKPKSLKEAKQMLKKLSNNKHLVITSICLKNSNKVNVFSSKTTVYINKLTNDIIDYYIKNYNPLDKAGGYGIQEWFGYVGVKKIKGSYFNVMGFPVHKFYKELKRF